MVSLPVAARQRMGAAGRRKVEQQFDEALVIRKYLDAITDVTAIPRRGVAIRRQA
jgi:arginine/lysine/ornithine decarboxylase